MLSLSNAKFGEYVHLIYPSELEIKDTTESLHSASYLDLYLEIDKNKNLCTRLYDKRGDFDFPIVNFPFLDSNIPASPVYGVFISQLIRYARACTTYKDFLSRGSLLTVRLLQQGYQHPRLKACLKKFYGHEPHKMGWLLSLTCLFLGLSWICCQIHNPCTLVYTLDFT